MGLRDRASCAAAAALGMIVIVGCSSPPGPGAFEATPAPQASLAPAPSVTTATNAAANAAPVTASVTQTRAVANAGATSSSPNDVRVMSFNCRVSTLFDLHNTWGLRKGLLVETVRTFNPDLLGTQECLAPQSDYLRDRLPGYDFVGVGRNDGKRRGEMCGVFFRADKFERLDSGHFWLSEKPGKPGSKGWGAVFPRMVTWVKLRPRNGSGATFCWFNTHLDAFSSKARANGAKLLRDRIAMIAGALPVLVTGDFNADAGSEPYRTLIGSSASAAMRLTDTFRAVNSTIPNGTGTRHGFLGGHGGPRIDWILASGAFRTIDADIDHTRSGMSFPSDHFPVTAVLRPNPVTTLAQDGHVDSLKRDAIVKDVTRRAAPSPGDYRWRVTK